MPFDQGFEFRAQRAIADQPDFEFVALLAQDRRRLKKNGNSSFWYEATDIRKAEFGRRFWRRCRAFSQRAVYSMVDNGRARERVAHQYMVRNGKIRSGLARKPMARKHEKQRNASAQKREFASLTAPTFAVVLCLKMSGADGAIGLMDQ